jgi:glycosyltransferase involved in cell wall biosynthesis
MECKAAPSDLTVPNHRRINLISKPVRICVVGEWLFGPLDEGIRNLSQNLIDEWRKDYQVSTIRIGVDLPVNRLFISWKLRHMLRIIQPDLIFYISPSSAKISALFRVRMLKAYAPQALVLIVATQPVAYNRIERWIASLFVPNGIFVQFPCGKALLKDIPCPVYFLPSGVDLARFVPVEADQKSKLRKKYGVDEKALVVLHVGHINYHRNIQLLSRVAGLQGVQALIVGSTSTTQDDSLIHSLSSKHVMIIGDYLPNIEEVYQLADVYLFPVNSEGAAVGVPLSILEAMACNLPVISTPFGGLPLLFEAGNGVSYFTDENELPQLIYKVRSMPSLNTRDRVKPYEWKKVAHMMIMMATSKEVH